MTSIEYNTLVDSLYRGHDVIFSYKEQHYFLERDDKNHNLYKVSENLDSSQFLQKFNGENLILRVNTFLEAKLFDMKSFNEIYSIVSIIDIE